MNLVSESVVAKMNKTRLKAYRTSVLAFIDKNFNTSPGHEDGWREPINRDSPGYRAMIKHRNMVNSYWVPSDAV